MSSPRPASHLAPREPARYPAHQDLERLLPAGRVYAVTRGHDKIFSLHTPMISGGRTRQSADLYREQRSVISTSTATHLTYDVFR